LLLNRAETDAQLALQLARTEQEQEKAREAWAKIQELKNDQR
jgi:C4-type Zn-finger protein